MHLVIGGAYQGKLRYAMEHFGVTPELVFDCSEDGIDFDAPCIVHGERYALTCVREGREASDDFRAQRERWRNAVILCDDISCGVVPIDPEMRAWREASGRLVNYLAGEAESVTRLFCSIPQVIK